jgi:hypothetical protein
MRRFRHPFTAAAAVLTLSVAVAAAAQAQQAAATTGLKEVEDESLMVHPFNLSVDAIEDMDLVGPNGDEIGDVEEVLADASGQPTSLAAEVGGFLGVGDKTVVIGLDQLRVENEKLVTGLTKEQLEALPEWDD